MERWKVFKSLPRVDILVSSYGKIKTVNKEGIEKYLSLYNRGGRRKQYYAFGYRDNGKKVLVSVHVAVALLFLGEKPSKNHQVDHIDNDPSNNSVANLRWITDIENGRKANFVYP
jgi:hypothetical protein